MRRWKRPCGSSRRWITAVRHSRGSTRVPAITSSFPSMDASTCSATTPGSATSTSTSSSVSRTSTGGSQAAEELAGRNSSRCMRSARANMSKAWDQIQPLGKSLSICHLSVVARASRVKGSPACHEPAAHRAISNACRALRASKAYSAGPALLQTPADACLISEKVSAKVQHLLVGPNIPLPPLVLTLPQSLVASPARRVPQGLLAAGAFSLIGAARRARGPHREAPMHGPVAHVPNALASNFGEHPRTRRERLPAAQKDQALRQRTRIVLGAHGPWVAGGWL